MKILKIDGGRRPTIPSDYRDIFEGTEQVLLAMDNKNPFFTVYPVQGATGHEKAAKEAFRYSFGLDMHEMKETDARVFWTTELTLLM